MPINRERPHGTRTSLADRGSPLLGNWSAEKAKTETTAREVDNGEAGHRLFAVPAVAEDPLQPVSHGDETTTATVPPAVLRQDALVGLGLSPRATYVGAAADDRQLSATSTSARSSIASGGLGLAAGAPRSEEHISVHGEAVGIGNTINDALETASVDTGGSSCFRDHRHDGYISTPDGLRERGGEEQLDYNQQIREMLRAGFTLAPLSMAVSLIGDLQHRYATATDQIIGLQDIVGEQERVHAQFAAALRNEMDNFQRRLELAESRAKSNGTRADNAELVVEVLQQQLNEVMKTGKGNHQLAMNCVENLTRRTDGLTAAVDELRQARAPRSSTPASESTHRSVLEQPESTSRAELSERNLRTFGEGGAIRQDVDLRSMRSARSALLPRPPALPAASLASPAPSVAAIAPARALSAGAPSSSLAATIPVNAPAPQPAAYKSMFAAPEPYVPLRGTDLDSASQQRDQMDMLKSDARAQLEGAARQARHPTTYTITHTQTTQGRLAEQMHAEALAVAAQRERDVKAEALAAAARRERERAQQEQTLNQQQVLRSEQSQFGAQAALWQRERDAQQRALDAQQAELRAEWRALDAAKSERPHARNSCAGGGGTSSLGGVRRGGDGIGGNGGDGGGGEGGDDGGSSSGAPSSGGDGARRASMAAAAPAAVAAAGAGDLSGFDSEGYANMRFAVTLDEKHFPKTKVDQGNISALTSLQRQLPGKFRSAALALRQKQRPLWPALCNADDFGCEWYVTAVYSIVNCIADGGGDHPRLNMLARQAASWEMQGSEQGLRDGALLSWLFTKIAKFLEIEEPTAVAANLMNWSLRQGLALKYFIVEFSDAAQIATSLDKSLDHIVVTALQRIIRHHYPYISGPYKQAILEPTARSADLLAILAEEAQGADHYSTAPLEDRPVYPTNLVSYGKGLNRGGGGGGGAGRSLPSKPNRDNIAAAAEKEARRAAAHEEQQRCQVQYAIYEICNTLPGRTCACFNCGSTEHVFARCDADYSAENWDAAVQRQPWVVKFRPSSAEDFKQLCARAVQGAERGERGSGSITAAATTALSPYDSGAGRRRLSCGGGGACGRRPSGGGHSFYGGATARNICSSCAPRRCDGSGARRRRAARGAFYCGEGAGERRTHTVSSSATERCGASGAQE
ncbi:hypothetical protein JKP88DRAFT_245894 [Tribonema minus]|uniref:Uncharacterized protein n=1 Tax=Tribonema minus TaxID=303371 RepID=A0A835Z2Q4_9STRA|nr:hypothetical protein JKP88DRAFT_245894 [Tribonema minus]